MAGGFVPSCIGAPTPGIKWRILINGEWLFVECKPAATEQPWEGGLAGSQAWLGLTDDERDRAYPVKQRRLHHG